MPGNRAVMYEGPGHVEVGHAGETDGDLHASGSGQRLATNLLERLIGPIAEPAEREESNAQAA